MTDTAARPADLTGDGREDFVLYLGWISCDGAASIYGDRDKAIHVYVVDESGAKSAFSDAVYGAKIEGTGNAARLWLTVSGAQCGKPPAVDFASENFCDRAIVWNAETRRFDYAPVASVRMIE